MKPKTKLEHRVVELSQHLLPLENKILMWAKEKCLEHKAFATKKKVTCMDCGQSFSTDLIKRKRAICPHCKVKLKIKETRKRTDKQKTLVAFAEIYFEFQIIRYFEIEVMYKAGEEANFFIREVLQKWIAPNGKYKDFGLNHTVNHYYESWNGDMEIRKCYSRYYNPVSKYDLYPQKYHPESKFKSEYRLYGINHNLQGLTFLEAIRLVPGNPQAETLLKAKYYDLLSFCNTNSGIIFHRWPSIKICIRNKYKVKDATMWLDYLDLLTYFGKDLRNAKYVCPSNLKREHDRLVAKKRKKQELEDLKRKREKALLDESKFRELKKQFFGIEFSDKEINIKVLESVKEHMEEGDKLKHCVFTNEYYLKPDSLILSARIDDKKIETVEVSLNKFKVIQSRGLLNNNTEYHDRIIELVNRNMNLIRKKVIS